MKKAFLVELTVLAGYIKQLLPIAAFTGVFVSAGMGTTVALAGILVCMFCMMGSMAASAYDDASNWGAYRLTLPLSRRDVVLGRYAAVAVMGALGIAMGALVQMLASTVGALGILPSEIGDMFVMSPDDVLTSIFGVFFCLLMGMTAASLAIPFYFKFGNTKATQFLPMAVMLLYVLVIFIFAQMSDGIDVVPMLSQFLAWVETPAGVATCAVVMAAVAVLILFVSAAVSMRIYARRDL